MAGTIISILMASWPQSDVENQGLLLPRHVQGRPVGLYAACLVHSTALILMWSELVARAPVARGSRSRSGRSEAPPSAACPHLKIDHVYVVPEAPLEPLVLVLLFQQSALGTMEPSHIPAPLATLWATPGAAPPVAVLWSPFRSGSHAGKTVEARPRNEVFQLAVRACLPAHPLPPSASLVPVPAPSAQPADTLAEFNPRGETNNPALQRCREVVENYKQQKPPARLGALPVSPDLTLRP